MTPLQEVALRAGPDARRMVERNRFVFDRWPPGGPNPASRLDEFDEVTRWQALAFSLYCELWRVTEAAEREAEDVD